VLGLIYHDLCTDNWQTAAANASVLCSLSISVGFYDVVEISFIVKSNGLAAVLLQDGDGEMQCSLLRRLHPRSEQLRVKHGHVITDRHLDTR